MGAVAVWQCDDDDALQRALRSIVGASLPVILPHLAIVHASVSMDGQHFHALPMPMVVRHNPMPTMVAPSIVFARGGTPMTIKGINLGMDTQHARDAAELARNKKSLEAGDGAAATPARKAHVEGQVTVRLSTARPQWQEEVACVAVAGELRFELPSYPPWRCAATRTAVRLRRREEADMGHTPLRPERARVTLPRGRSVVIGVRPMARGVQEALDQEVEAMGGGLVPLEMDTEARTVETQCSAAITVEVLYPPTGVHDKPNNAL